MITDRDFLERVERLFQQVLDIDPRNRAKHIAQAAAEDERLRLRVQALLDALDEADANQAWDTTAVQQLAADSLDTDLDRYRLLERIGIGGMGAVYKAVRADDEFSKLVAVKIVLIPDSNLIGRFRRERQMLAGLEHPNIARLLDGGTSKNGSPFLVMEYVDGIPIHRYVQEKKLSVRDTLALLRKVCGAVSYAHRNLIVHRDLKPGNILVTTDGEPKLLDFGIAKLMDGTSEHTRTGLLAMTPEYASPEQIRGSAITTATDIYSLGVVLYELLTGARPYATTQGPLELAEAITQQQPLPLGRSFDPDLENIVRMALRKEPERRYVSVDQFADDLRRYAEGLPVLAHRDSVAYRAEKFVRRHAVGVAAAALTLVILLAAIAGTAWEAHIARTERSRAERRFNDVRKIADSFLFEFNDSIERIPGTLAARQLIVKRAMEYLDSLAQEAGEDLELKTELADAYQKVGTITFDVDARLAIHRKELALRQSIAQAKPANVTYQTRLAGSYTSMGDAIKDSGNLRAALENYRAALAIDETLVKKDPANTGVRFETANACELVAGVVDAMGDFDQALALRNRALDLVAHVMRAGPPNPDHPQLMMVLRHNIAGTLSKKGDVEGAIKQIREGLKLAEQMSAADPSNARNRRNLWATNQQLAELLVQSRDAASGLQHYTTALSYIKGLAEADPGDKGHRRALAITYLGLGDASVAANQFSAALPYYKQAIATSEALLAIDSHKLETRVDLAAMYTHLGMNYAKLGRSRDALAFLQKGVSFYDAASVSDPASAKIQRGRAEAREQLAALGRRASARARL